MTPVTSVPIKSLLSNSNARQDPPELFKPLSGKLTYTHMCSVNLLQLENKEKYLCSWTTIYFLCHCSLSVPNGPLELIFDGETSLHSLKMLVLLSEEKESNFSVWGRITFHTATLTKVKQLGQESCAEIALSEKNLSLAS